ncbi:unnamed protein product [Dicrocoelium dendriticum]|nr:unnamed protein product [Dicrocoelium dendriticum]
MIEMREKYAVMLSRRVESLAPNLYSLLNSALPQDSSSSSQSSNSLRISDNISASLVAARLILNAGSLTRLASMTASRVLSLGASKALFRKSGAVAATSTGLLNSICQSSIALANDQMSVADDEPIPMTAARMKALSGNRLQPDIVRRRAARLLAAKSSLACKADCFRFHNPVENDDDDTKQPSTSTEDPRLASGAFGVHLAADVQRQLKIWAETNGVYLDRTRKQEVAQRQRRKRYRKAKRKAWLARKLSQAATGCELADSGKGTDLENKVNAVVIDDVDMDATLASPSHSTSTADSVSQNIDSSFAPSIGRQSLRGKQCQLVSATS